MIMSNNKPIGLFDSGVGGLSVLQHVQQLLPNEDILYVADSGYAPYGCKDEEFIEQRSRVITENLLEQGAKVIVIACNTATASIIEKFRKQYGIPFIGVEPGIKPAINISKNGSVGIMATVGTLSSTRYYELSNRFGRSVKLYNQACPGLADQVEAGQVDAPETLHLLNSFLSPLMQQQVDTIVLGCTHYSFLTSSIHKIVGESVSLVDTSRAIAEQLLRVLEQEKLTNLEGNETQSQGKVSYFTTGSVSSARHAMSRLLGQDVIVSQLS